MLHISHVLHYAPLSFMVSLLHFITQKLHITTFKRISPGWHTSSDARRYKSAAYTKREGQQVNKNFNFNTYIVQIQDIRRRSVLQKHLSACIAILFG